MPSSVFKLTNRISLKDDIHHCYFAETFLHWIMKKHVLIILLAGCITFITQAQDSIEFTTYYAEKAQFTIDLPDNWTTALAEEKIKIPGLGYGTAINSIDASEEGTMLFVLSVLGCMSPAKKYKTYKKVFEKNAKKSNDTAFRIIAEGQEVDASGKKYNWLDYIHTLEMDDGSKIVLREMFYVRCNTASMSKYANTFRFFTKENNWEKNKPLFEEIYSTVKFIKNKDK